MVVPVPGNFAIRENMHLEKETFPFLATIMSELFGEQLYWDRLEFVERISNTKIPNVS